jgi:DNA-binding IclR family transcriptional regulator
MPKPRKPDAQPVKSAMRTLALLEYFRRAKASASVTELSSALAMPQSSTSVLLKSLVSLNYLEYDSETRRFLPSYRVALLGDWIQRARFGDERITDIMELLRSDTGETVMLGQQIGARMQYLHVLPATHPIQLMIPVDEIRPMSRTALGQILLSCKPNSQIRAIVRRNNADESKVSAHFRETAFIQEIEGIRQRGYSETKGRTTPGANTIGMLVPSSGKQSLLAIGVGGPIDRIGLKRRQIIDAMRRRLGATL